MTSTPEEQISLAEKNEGAPHSQETAPQPEISAEELSAWSGGSLNDFKSETERASEGLNSIGLSEQEITELKNETHINEELAGFDKEAEDAIRAAGEEVSQLTPEQSGTEAVAVSENGEAEGAKIYEDPNSDPIIAEMDKNIQQRVTNYLGTDFEAAEVEPARVHQTMNAYENFLDMYPEKAEKYLAYGEEQYAGREDAGVPNWYGHLKKAHEMQEEKQQIKEVIEAFGLENGGKVVVEGQEYVVDFGYTERHIEFTPSDKIVHNEGGGWTKSGTITFGAKDLGKLTEFLSKREDGAGHQSQEHTGADTGHDGIMGRNDTGEYGDMSDSFGGQRPRIENNAHNTVGGAPKKKGKGIFHTSEMRNFLKSFRTKGGSSH